jgi:uncharacterized protein YuzE
MDKVNVYYDPATDSLSINLTGKPAAESEEVADNVIVGYDDQNRVVLIEFMGGVRKIFAPLIKGQKTQEAKAANLHVKGK